MSNIFNRLLCILNNRLFASFILILAPWMLLLFITQGVMGQSVFHSSPLWSDELGYWHEVLSLSQKSLDYGYYSFFEQIPQFCSFGTHGFGTVSIYACFAFVFGWKYYSIVLANTFFVSLAFTCLVIINKISPLKIFLIAIFYVTYVPIVLYSATSMSELLNFSLIIIVLSLFQGVITFTKYTKLFLALLVLFVLISSLVRINYILFLLPICFIHQGQISISAKVFIKLLLLLIIAVLLFVFVSKFTTPFPFSFLVNLNGASCLREQITLLIAHFIDNSFNLLNPFSADYVQVFQRYFVLLVMVFCFIKSRIIQSKGKNIVLFYFGCFVSIFAILLVTILLYDVFDWRDFRVVAPVLFGVSVLIIVNERTRFSYFLIGINLVAIFVFYLTPSIPSAVFDQQRYVQIPTKPLFKAIKYQDDPLNAFENTLVSSELDRFDVLNLPAGIGITYSNTYTDNLKSKYVFTKTRLSISTYKLIDSSEYGILYQKIAPLQ